MRHAFASSACCFVLALTPVVSAQTPTAEAREPGTTRIDAYGITQVWVPAGSFIAGSTQDEADSAYRLCLKIWPDMCLAHEYAAERFQHEATLTYGYWMDAYEVTNADYDAFVEADGYQTRDYWSEDGWRWKGQMRGPNNRDCRKDLLDPTQPRVCITWYEADAYAHWRGGSLPTEAEWEYAARGPEGLIYPWGDEVNGSRLNVCDTTCPNQWRDTTLDDGVARSAPVGSYPEGVSWIGAYDLAGNVWEWTANWFDPLYNQSEETVDPPAPDTGIEKVLRGGSWNMPALFARSAYRDGVLPDSWSGIIGFRVVTHENITSISAR